MKDDIDTVALATELTVAWLSNPHTRGNVEDVPAFLRSMHDELTKLGSAPTEAMEQEPAYVPAVSVRKSLASDDHIVSMIDGKPYRSLRRHLNARGLTPDEYRQRYGLKADYPMVARAYSDARRVMALARGLGRKATAKVEAVVEDKISKGGSGKGARKAVGPRK